MLRRCEWPGAGGYRNYGARGITVCARWHTFEHFLADMGERPSLGHSIDRIDNDGHYEPGNCRWATASEQRSNTRFNHLLTFRGETLTLAQWADRLGMGRTTLDGRINRFGWTVERALSEAPGRPRKRLSLSRASVVEALKAHGSYRAAARALHVSPRTVERVINGTREKRAPLAALLGGA